MSRAEIFEEISAERTRQDNIWGGPGHDDTHDISDWVLFIKEHARMADPLTPQPEESRRRLIEVAALAVAAIESLDRKPATK